MHFWVIFPVSRPVKYRVVDARQVPVVGLLALLAKTQRSDLGYTNSMQ